MKGMGAQVAVVPSICRSNSLHHMSEVQILNNSINSFWNRTLIAYRRCLICASVICNMQVMQSTSTTQHLAHKIADPASCAMSGFY